MLKPILSVIVENDLTIDIDSSSHLIGKYEENDIGLSSIEYVELIVMVEEKFNIIFDFETQLVTVGDLFNYINNYEPEE